MESGLPYEIVFVKVTRSIQENNDYLRINPRGKVPALETGEGILTESAAILPFIADLVPEKMLLPPPGTFARGVGQAWLSFLSSSLHAAYSGVMHPLDEASAVERQASLNRLIATYQDVDARLDGRRHLLDTFSVCDLYLLVFALWRSAPHLVGKLPTLQNIDQFQQELVSCKGYGAILGEELKLRSETS